MRAFRSAAAASLGFLLAPCGLAQQASVDPALQELNKCVAGAAGTTEAEIFSRLNPALNDPDRVAWCLYLYVNSNAATSGNNNALFETWASDNDTFQENPNWPGPGTTEKPLRRPILPQLAKQPTGGLTPFVLPFESTQCQTQSQPCVGEEVRRNRPTFDFIKDNKLYSRDGLRAYSKPIVFPADSIEVKANWVPVSQIPQFLAPSGSGVNPLPYHVNTTTENGQQVQYALVSFHIISKMVPNWTWATFEHVNNPGRCDTLGCIDSFGATPSTTAPHSLNTPPNQQYPVCNKTAALTALFASAKIDPAFANYCLKGSQTDFTDAQGVNTRVGNSVTEAGFVDTASCITCHGRAAYTFMTGGWATNRVFIYNSTPIGPIGPLDAGQFYLFPQQDATRPLDPTLFHPTDFVWSIPFCAIDSSGKSGCVQK